jgi:hypothetical protein
VQVGKVSDEHRAIRDYQQPLKNPARRSGYKSAIVQNRFSIYLSMAKKKRSPEKMYEQVQDAVQALPYAIAEHQKNGRRTKAFVLRYVSGPMLRLMKRALGAKRYRGDKGGKRRQTDQMRRHLKQKQQAIKHFQDEMQKQQRRQRPQ